MVQSANSRNAIKSSDSVVRAICMISPATDDIGAICGVTPSGKRSRAMEMRSATNWRLR